MTTPNRPSANPNDESDSTVADLDKRVFRVETLVDIEKSLGEKIETLGRDLRKELGERIEAQGKDLSEKIEAQGERIETLGKDLSNVRAELGERIEAQGKNLSEKIEAQGKNLSKVKGTLYILVPLIVATFAVILNMAFRGGTL